MSWPVVPLGKALDTAIVFVDGDWVESKDQDPAGDVRLIQLADVGDGYYVDKSNRFLTSNAAQRLKCTFLEAGDLLIARMPDPLGRACIYPGDSKRAVTVVDVCIIRPDSNTVHTPWLMYCINSPQSRNQIDGYITGTTRQRISRGNLVKIKVALPPLEEQRRIAVILDQAETLRTQRRTALAQLDSLTQSLFLDMFGDPVANPKGFVVTTLSDITKFENGDRSSNYPSGDEVKTEGVLFLSTKNIVASKLDLSKSQFITQEKFDSLSRGKAKSGDLIITLRGTLGSCCVFDCNEETAFINAQMMIIRPTAKVSSQYLHTLLTSDEAKAHFDYIGRGAAVPQLTSGQLGELKVLLPPLALQETFATRIQAIESLKTTHRTALTELDALFASLQQRAFAGEL